MTFSFPSLRRIYKAHFSNLIFTCKAVLPFFILGYNFGKNFWQVHHKLLPINKPEGIVLSLGALFKEF